MIQRGPTDGALPAARTLAVVGADFDNRDKAKSNRRYEILLCKPGDPVTLVPEPDNPADDCAVAVYSERGIQIGYLPAERCGLIGKYIRDGLDVCAVFQVQTAFGAYIRASFDGITPTVDLDAKPMRPGRGAGEGVDPEPEFEPDPVWDD